MNHSKSTIQCPYCEASLTVDATLEGRRGRCPRCRERFIIESSGSTRDIAANASETKLQNHPAKDTERRSGEAKSATDRSPTRSSKALNQSDETSLGQIGRFQLREILGQGAFGRVYRAYDPQLDRMLALKVPIFHEDELKKAARFEQEAKAAAHLRHPNIVPVFDSGKVDNYFYIASQFIEGVPLSTHLRNGPLSFSQAAIWARQIARALAYAHEMGIVHRDVKPQNILLDTRNEPQLMDFGLAKRVNEDSSMTTEGSLLGTPAYMSPEQARGDVANVGPKSDQYALGAVLFEMLTGKRVYEGPPHAVLAQILSAVIHSPQSFHPDVPNDLSAITLKAMNQSPSQRYASCEELALDLDRWLHGESVIARAPNFFERTLRIAKRHKAMSTLSVGLVSVITVSLVSVSWALFQAHDARNLAEKNLVEAKKQTELANQQTQVAKQQRDLAESEKQRAELAESTLLKKQETLQHSVYASRLSQIDDGWKQNRDSYRLSRELDAIATDQDMTNMRGFEWYYWRNRFDRLFREFPLSGNSLNLSYIIPRGSCCFSDDGELVLVCDSHKALIWETKSRKLSKTIESHRYLLANEAIASGFLIKVNGELKMLMNLERSTSTPSQSPNRIQEPTRALVVDVQTEKATASFPGGTFLRVPGAGFVVRQLESKNKSYKTYPAGESLGMPMSSDWELACIDVSKNRRLVYSSRNLEWRTISDDSAATKLDIDELEKGRLVNGVSVSLALQQVLVDSKRSQADGSQQAYVLNLNSLKQIDIQKLNTQTGLAETVFGRNQPKTLIRLVDSLHVTEDPRWSELDSKSAWDKSIRSIAIQSRLLDMSPVNSQIACVVGAKSQSNDSIPILISPEKEDVGFQYELGEGDFFRDRMENGPPRFTVCRLLDESLTIRVLNIHNDGSKTEAFKTINYPFRKSSDKNRQTYQIRFSSQELCGLSRDGRSIQFFSLDKQSGTPTRTITLDEEADFIIIDPTESRLAVTHKCKSIGTKPGSIHYWSGRVSIIDLALPDSIKAIAYEHYYQCSPVFDNSGQWLFLHNGGLVHGHKDGVIHTQQFEDDVNATNRTKIYDAKTGELIVDVPLPEGQTPTRVAGDAIKGVFARGTYIYDRDGSKRCEIENGSSALGFSIDGNRLITQNAIVDPFNGEVLLQLSPEQSRIFLQGAYGYCIRDKQTVQWFPFSRH